MTLQEWPNYKPDSLSPPMHLYDKVKMDSNRVIKHSLSNHGIIQAWNPQFILPNNR